METVHTNRLPTEMLQQLEAARSALHLTQRELGQRTGMPQMHISNIESGKTVPRVDTLLDLVRVLNLDLLMVPRELVPAIRAMIGDTSQEQGDEPLYMLNPEDEEREEAEQVKDDAP